MEQATIAIFHGAGQPFSLQTQPLVEPQKGEVLVKNSYTCICSSDLHTYNGRRIEKCPTILGHEIVGSIAQLPRGEKIIDLRGNIMQEGDKITWAIFSSNPLGKLAQMGIPQKSDNLFKYGHEKLTPESTLHGGLASHILLRANTPIVVIKNNIPDNVLAIINCSVATVAGAIRLAGPIHNKTVLVSGLGMLGIVACAMCSSLGAKVLASDTNAIRLNAAADFGATPTVKSQDVDIVLEFSGALNAMEQTLNTLTIGGVAVWVGATFPQENIKINAEKVVRNLYTIKGLHNYNTADFITAVEFMEQYHSSYPFAQLITGGFTLNSINKAFAYAAKHNPYRLGINLL